MTGREQLRAACLAEGLTEREAQSVFDPWGGTLRYLAETGRICYRVQQKKEFCLCPAFRPLPRGQAELERAEQQALRAAAEQTFPQLKKLELA